MRTPPGRAITPATTTLLAGVVALPVAGLLVKPFAVVGAIVVLFALLIAGIDAHTK